MNINKVRNDVINIIPWTDQPKERKFKCQNCDLEKDAYQMTSIWGHNGNETVICKECFKLYIKWSCEYLKSFEI